MKNLRTAFILIFIFSLCNTLVGGACYQYIGISEGKGYLIGTALSFILSLLWVLGASKSMKSNTMVLLTITLGGYPLRLVILAIFAFSGLYIFKMDTTFFAISFLIGTILSLVIEIWFFNTMSVSGKKKLN